MGQPSCPGAISSKRCEKTTSKKRSPCSSTEKKRLHEYQFAKTSLRRQNGNVCCTRFDDPQDYNDVLNDASVDGERGRGGPRPQPGAVVLAGPAGSVAINWTMVYHTRTPSHATTARCDFQRHFWGLHIADIAKTSSRQTNVSDEKLDLCLLRLGCRRTFWQVYRRSSQTISGASAANPAVVLKFVLSLSWQADGLDQSADVTESY